MISLPKHILELKRYQPGKSTEEIKRQFGLEHIIKLASNENPMGASPKAIQAISKSFDTISRYPDISSRLLKLKLADAFNLDVNNIITGSGSESIMSVAIRSLLQNEDEVLTSEGTFIGLYVITKASGHKLVQIPLKNYAYDLDGILEHINSKTKIIYLANPNNPTGSIFTIKEFESFIDKVPKNILLIIDEAYYEFAKDNPNYPDSLNYRLDNILTLRTFSKAYGIAGLRVGYGFAHQDLIHNFEKVRLPFEPTMPSQLAATAALDDQLFLEEYLELNRNGREYLYSAFDNLNIKYIKSDANFIMSIYDSEDTANIIAYKLLERGVIVRGLKAFGLPHCIRVTIGLKEENEIFVEKFTEVLSELK